MIETEGRRQLRRQKILRLLAEVRNEMLGPEWHRYEHVFPAQFAEARHELRKRAASAATSFAQAAMLPATKENDVRFLELCHAGADMMGEIQRLHLALALGKLNVEPPKPIQVTPE